MTVCRSLGSLEVFVSSVGSVFLCLRAGISPCHTCTLKNVPTATFTWSTKNQDYCSLIVGTLRGKTDLKLVSFSCFDALLALSPVDSLLLLVSLCTLIPLIAAGAFKVFL